MLGSSPRVRGTPYRIGDTTANRGIIPACAGNTLACRQKSIDSRDHPRVCGEHAYWRSAGIGPKGSSPRVRGTPRPCVAAERVPGIIPACAGNTTVWMDTAAGFRDHPRVCGEHHRIRPSPSTATGSSPRVRGTLNRHDRKHHTEGIIPACAGNTRCRTRASTACRDHPRVCGEHPMSASVSVRNSGSSPRVRGTLDDPFHVRAAVGIIPACAGNTDILLIEWGYTKDHPRVCGEHSPCRPFAIGSRGSSPRVRGTRACHRDAGIRNGIIPACAGNTSPFQAISRFSMGSSPRVRGTQSGAPIQFVGLGIIPACAGNTPRKRTPRPRGRDHPRVCGEHAELMDGTMEPPGSSPRVRGTHVEPY